MKKFLLMLLPLAAMVTGCRYDDSEVWDELNNHETRILALERAINTDLVNLQGIVSQLESKVYVSSVTPTTGGFTITFTDGKTYTVTNGTNGSTPAIGAKQDTDGYYYWTLNGEWLTDAAGNKIRTTGDKGDKGEQGDKGDKGDKGETGDKGEQGDKGETGSAGVTPQVKIDNNKWYVSVDGGTTWTEAGDATVVGDSLFKDVKLSDDGKTVIFTFQDNSTIEIPIVPTIEKLQLLFDETKIASILSGETATVDYTIVIPEGETVEFDTFENNGYTVKVTATDATSGSIAVTAPDPAVKGKVLFILTGDKGSSFVKTVTINGDPTLSAPVSEYNVDAAAGEITITLKANVAYTSTIEAGKTWITAGTQPNKFNIEANDTEDDRSANITFKAEGVADVTVKVTQAGKDAIVLVTTDPVLEADADEFDVVITTNAVVTATPDVDWIHIAEPTKAAKTNKTFSFTLDANTTSEDRTGHIEFTATDVKQTVTVTQKAPVLTIADLKTMDNGAFSGNFKNVTVSYVVGRYTYIEDETGGIPVYKNGGVGLTAGQVINGPVSGTKGEYGKAPQLTALDITGATVTEGEAPLTEVTIEALLADYDKYFGRRVKLTDVTVTQAMSATAKAGKVKQGENEYQIYNSDANNALTLEVDDLVDLICFPGSYNGTPQGSVFTGLSVYKGKEKPVLKFIENFSLKVGETTSISGSTNSDGALTYTSSNPAVATIGASDGFLTALSEGTTTITVSVAETDNFRAASASCTLTVTEAEVTTGSGTLEDPYTITGVIAYIDGLEGATSADVYVKGVVSELTNFKFGPTFNTATFWMTEDGNASDVKFEAYACYYFGGSTSKWYDGISTQIAIGQEVVVFGKVVLYINTNVSTYETVNKKAQIYSIDGKTADPTGIVASDVTGVAAEGVTDNTMNVTFVNADGWTPSVTPDGTVVTAASISGNTITYSVAANTGEARDGKITIKLSKTGETDITKDVKVSQLAASAGGESESTLIFTEKCNGSGTASGGVSWTVTSDGTESNFDNNKGIHYGTNSAAVQYIKLTTSDITGTVKKIIVNASTASGVSATVGVTIGESSFGGDPKALSTSAADYTFEGSASGEIVVTVTKPEKAAKALYVKSIIVTYE